MNLVSNQGYGQIFGQGYGLGLGQGFPADISFIAQASESDYLDEFAQSLAENNATRTASQSTPRKFWLLVLNLVSTLSLKTSCLTTYQVRIYLFHLDISISYL